MIVEDIVFNPFLNQPSSKRMETPLQETRTSAFVSELITNSGHFLLLNALSEISLMGWWDYLTYPGHYLIIAAMLVQAAYLCRAKAHHFWGNFIGAAMYTLVDFPLEGWEFFSEPNHLVLWGFAGAIALLQGLRFHWFPRAFRWIVPLESLVRIGMFIALYVALKLKSENLSFAWENIIKFTQLSHHQFLVEALLITGLFVGLQTLQVMVQRRKLQETALVLQNLARWGLGTYAVNAAMNDPRQLRFQRRERTFVFMDVRGFTQWCERTSPDEVADTLNQYYQIVEPAATSFQPLRVSLTADEVMAIYATVEQGVGGAMAMQDAAKQVLSPLGLGAGCAVHSGTAIEGLFGGEDSRTYTAIGDVVNTAKRLESSTPAGEITISRSVLQAMGNRLQVKSRSPVAAKGKTEPLAAWQLLGWQP